jgi:hypothetical protein
MGHSRVLALAVLLSTPLVVRADTSYKTGSCSPPYVTTITINQDGSATPTAACVQLGATVTFQAASGGRFFVMFGRTHPFQNTVPVFTDALQSGGTINSGVGNEYNYIACGAAAGTVGFHCMDPKIIVESNRPRHKKKKE